MLFQSEYIVITQEYAGRILRYRRTAVPFPSLEAAERTYEQVLSTYDRVGRQGRGLLVDSRDAQGRNDPEFESSLIRFRSRAIPGFSAYAVLMRTAVGMLQAQRMNRSLRGDPQPFLTTDQEDEAIRFLLAQLRSPRAADFGE